METLQLASRLDAIKPSPTLGLSAKAAEMRRNGVDVLAFSLGEPDFDTPQSIKDAASQALSDGYTKYAPTPGIPELREAISQKFAIENHLQYKPEQILVSTGAKQCLYNAFMALLEPGDEVILLAPYWVTYADQIHLAGGKSVIVESFAESGFVPTIEDIQAAVSPKSRAIVVNSPCNPTGAVFPDSLMKEIAEFAVRNNLWIITDEIYEHLTYGRTSISLAGIDSRVYDRTITINGCSKTYAMTGWRIGYAAGPTEVIKAMSKVQDQVTSGATTFAQKGAVAALHLPHAEVEKMRATFEERRNLLLSLLREIPGLVVPNPEGAFYAFFGVQHYLTSSVKTDVALSEYLLEKAHVALVPGTAFGSPGHLRFSYAASLEQIEEGVKRLSVGLSALG